MGEAVEVREAVPADAEAAVDLWKSSHVIRRNGRPLPEAHIASAYQRMSVPGALLLLAHDPCPEGAPDGARPPVVGTILGVQGLDRDGLGPAVPGLVHVCLLSVAPDRWGQHIGRLLVEQMLLRAAEHGYRRAQLWTHADNLRANRLYKAMGFRRSGRVRVDDWGELLVHYWRTLEG
ncbi:GNAT family N-acetyltransferase [Streptacidiphilus albus]|uniref:GNAT family N-acetyltransferase n=1 Tax=Streptacidiphilus albus TaxID=105425 RepID=UPI00054BE593|nr:GNAT family N-acetyltransferase [Streptacidiphilus albus]